MMEKILESSNLSRALRKVRQNKGAAGIDGMRTNQLLPYFATNGRKLVRALRRGTYRPSPVRQVEIPKEGGKTRCLGIPTVTDRFVQQAILQALQPVFEPTFSDASYGFRPKRNPHGAVRQCRDYVNAGYVWAVDLDIEKFFDTVSQPKLMSLLAEAVPDDRLCALIGKFLRAGALRRGRFEPTRRGVPQGGPLSPLLANILLDRLDKELERLGLKFVRYADDMVILCRTKTEAKQALAHAAAFLENELRLRVNRDKTAVVFANKIQFLGFGFYRKGNEFRLRVHPKALRRMKSRIDALLAGYDGQNSHRWQRDLREYIRGWVGYYRLADLGSTLKAADEFMQRQLRQRLKELWAKAMADILAGGAASAGGVARARELSSLLSGASPASSPALSKRRLEKSGFPLFSAHYLAIAC